MRTLRQVVTTTLVAFMPVLASADAHEFGCPHSAARALSSFRIKSSSDTQFDSIASTPGWALLTVGSGEIPGLNDDNTLDQQNTATAHYAVYKAGTYSDRSYWMHRYGDGDIVTSTVQGDEGVGNLHRIKDDASEKKFVFANVKTMNVRSDDINWSNTIFSSPTEGPRTRDLRSFTAINEKFLATMPASDAQSLGSKTLFVTTSRAPDGEEILTIFTRTKEGHWVGFARSVTNYKSGTLNELQWHLNRIGKGGRLFVYGDYLPSVDFTAMADRAAVDTIYRAADVQKRFINTNRRLNQIADRPLKKATTTLVNGVPATAEELASAGLPESGMQKWREFHQDIEKNVEGHYDRRISGKSAFIRELTTGSSDMIVIVAHSDGPAIYIGKDRVTLAELQKLPRRNGAASRARVAFLLSCDTGKLTAQQAGVFRQKMNSLATILVDRNFVDQVVAPDHTIGQDETVAVLRDLLSGKSAADLRRGYAGWQKLAVLRRVLGLV